MAIQQGANPEELRALGRQFTLRSRAVTNAQRSIDQLTARLPQVWAGSDAEEFTRQWAQIHRPTFAKLAADLREGATTLAANADAQERTSAELTGTPWVGTPDVSSPGTGAPGTPGAPAAPSDAGVPGDLPWVPNWLEDKDSPFRQAWSTWSLVKAFPKLRAGLFDLGAMGTTFGLGSLNPFSSTARLTWNLAKPQYWPDELLTTGLSRAFNASSDAVSGNWHKLLGLTEEATAFKAFNVATKGLGLLGAGMDGLSAVSKFSDGNIDGGIASTIKAGLGVAAVFAPPPANVIAGVVTAGWSLYDNVPAVKGVVDDAAGAVADGAKAVAHFFGF